MTGIALEVMSDAVAPQVGITVTGLASSSTSMISLDWSVDGYEWHPVTGTALAQRAVVTGGGFWRHLLCPLNAWTQYRLTVHSGATIPDTLVAAILVPSDVAWVQDALNPRAAVPVRAGLSGDAVQILAGSLTDVTLSQPVDLVPILGERLPVASVGQRQAMSGASLGMFVAAEQGALVKALAGLAQSGLVALRGLPDEAGVDPVVYAVAPDLKSSPVVGYGRDWTWTLTQTRGPSPRIVVPWWTYAQVEALWPGASYRVLMDARPGDTYLDWLRDPSPGG